MNTCRPAISPSAVNADQESKYDDVSNDDLSVSNEYRIRDAPAIKELILAVWIFSLLCEEVRQVNLIVLFLFLIKFQFYRSSSHPKHILYERKQRRILEYFGIY